MGSAIKALFLATGLLAVSGAMAQAGAPNDIRLQSPLRYPGAPKPPSDEPASPYAMTYSEEVAQSLGVRDGHMDVFSSRPAPDDPLMPVVSGGLGGDGAMLKLQWHPNL